jgi:hypothetical protein
LEFLGSQPLDGVVSSVSRGPDRALWLVTHWMVEARVPFLWRSIDGLRWETVRRPGKENPTSLSIVGLCFRDDTLLVQLEDGDNTDDPEHPEKTEVWGASIARLRLRSSSPSGDTTWRLLDLPKLTCATDSLRGGWRREVTLREHVSFWHGARGVRIPRMLCRTPPC